MCLHAYIDKVTNVSCYTLVHITCSEMLSTLQVGVSAGDIGVIAPYRSQVLYLREYLDQGQSRSEVEVNTVDQYQGRDKNIIIISFVMSCKTGKSQVLHI